MFQAALDVYEMASRFGANPGTKGPSRLPRGAFFLLVIRAVATRPARDQ